MSLRETPMTLWYWNKVGGVLIEEFMAVPAGPGQARRLIDAVIVLGERKRRMPVSSRFELTDRDVIVVQTKNIRLGMYLMGQTLFSRKLIQRYFKPRNVRAVALCAKTDAVMQPMLEAHTGCEVVVCPARVCRRN